MLGKKTSRSASICRAVMSVCLVGSFSFTLTAFENPTDGHGNDSAAYVKQISLDISSFPSRDPRLRTAAASRPALAGHGLAQLGPPAAFPLSYVNNPLLAAWLNPQSRYVFNPTTRSPPEAAPGGFPAAA